MTPQAIVAILFDLFSGTPWEPEPGIKISADPQMAFTVQHSADRITVTWSKPYATVRVKKFGITVGGKLTGVWITRDKLTAIIDGLPDVTLDL